MTQEKIDESTSWTAGQETPPSGSLDICTLMNLMFCDIEIYRPTTMCTTLTKNLDIETGIQRKIKVLLYYLPREIDQNSPQSMGIPTGNQGMGITHLLLPERRRGNPYLDVVHW